MDCTLFDELISKELDGALTPEEEAGLADHLAACPACSGEAEKARKAEILLKGLAPVEPSAAFDEQLNRRIALHRRATGGRRGGGVFSRLMSVAAGIAIGVILAGAFHFGFMRSQPTPETRNTAREKNRPEDSNLVRLANHNLRHFVNGVEPLHADAHDLACTEPEQALSILDNEIEGLDIPKRMENVKLYREVYKRRNPQGVKVLDSLLEETRDVVDTVRACRRQRNFERARIADLKLRADTSLRRISALREFYNVSIFSTTASLHQPKPVRVVIPQKSNAVQLYVRGLHKLADGEAAPAFQLFSEVEQSFPNDPVAHWARDKMILIQAAAGQRKGDVSAVSFLEQKLGQTRRLSPVTLRHIQNLMDAFMRSSAVGPTQKRQIRVKIYTQPVLAGSCTSLSMIQILGMIGAVLGVSTNRRRVNLSGEDRKRLLRILRYFPYPWNASSFMDSTDLNGQRRIKATFRLPRGFQCTYPDTVENALKDLDSRYPAHFDSRTLQEIEVEAGVK